MYLAQKPEGPSTQYARPLVPKTIEGMGFRTKDPIDLDLLGKLLGALGKGLTGRSLADEFLCFAGQQASICQFIPTCGLDRVLLKGLLGWR